MQFAVKWIENRFFDSHLEPQRPHWDPAAEARVHRPRCAAAAAATRVYSWLDGCLNSDVVVAPVRALHKTPSVSTLPCGCPEPVWVK
jgi:hypothetical protein